MALATAGYNALCDGLAAVVTHLSLHSGDPSTTGANELTGGSPAYARKTVGWAAAATGQRASNTAQTFDVPAGITVYHVGMWSALTAGTFYGYTPVGGFSPQEAVVAAATDTFTSYAHGYSNGQTVVVADFQAAGVPTGLTEGSIYFIIGSATDTFQLSATSGGSAVNVTADGELVVQRILPEVFAAQGQYSIPSGSTIIDARAI